MASGSPTSEQVHNAFQSCRFGADEFLRTGVPISHRFTYDYLPIHYAAIEGRECLVRYSLENRIDPNSSTCYGSTALHFAAREGRLEIARLLLNHGADVNARDFNNATPLHYAVAEQRTELMELLIDYGANKRAENLEHQTPFNLAWNDQHRHILLTRTAIWSPATHRNQPQHVRDAIQELYLIRNSCAPHSFALIPNELMLELNILIAQQASAQRPAPSS